MRPLIAPTIILAALAVTACGKPDEPARPPDVAAMLERQIGGLYNVRVARTPQLAGTVVRGVDCARRTDVDYRCSLNLTMRDGRDLSIPVHATCDRSRPRDCVWE